MTRPLPRRASTEKEAPMEPTEEPPGPDQSTDEPGIPDHAGPLDAKEATGDPQEGVTPPGDRPEASLSWGTTALEQREGEPLTSRLDRERRDEAVGEGAASPGWRRNEPGSDWAGRIADYDEPDDTPELVADPDTDRERETISAEEAAVREEEEEEAPREDGDGSAL
jgi:hypothetical protein